MSDKKTWIILTDGYYIKIVLPDDSGQNLIPLREDDFQESSDITYNLITRYRKSVDAEGKKINPEKYFWHLLKEFLSEKADSGKYNSLIFIAPQEVLDILDSVFPDEISNKIVAQIPGDFLSDSQDKLEETLIPMLK